jgi:SWI/SNF-related matrix-associated actin-dependent regulator 1 of chromatin subfamily A
VAGVQVLKSKVPTKHVIKKTEPFPYQKIGIFRLVNRYSGRALLSDDVGLGKSIQALYASIPFRRRSPILIVCPSSVKYGWERQIKEHTNLTCQILKSQTPPRGGIKNPADVLIINWEILQFWEKALIKAMCSVIIPDEIHYGKNATSKRSKALRAICKTIKHIICLSGTPIENGPVEFFVPLNILRPDLFPNFKKFAYRYSKPKFTHWGVKFSGAQNVKELNRLLKTKVMVRRTKAQVLKNLPKILRSVVPMEIDENKYRSAEKDIVRWIMENKPKKAYKANNAVGQAKLNHLLQIIGDLKFKSVVAWIENFLETTDKKLTVFGHHRAFLEKLNYSFKNKSVLVYGGIGGKKRQERIQKFVSNDSTRLFIGGILAVGTGVNDLQKVCSDMAVAELIWVGLKILQAEGRLHRIGQKHQVNVSYLIAHGTAEEMLCKAILRKQKDVNATVDAKFSKSEFDIFSTVLQSIMKGNK